MNYLVLKMREADFKAVSDIYENSSQVTFQHSLKFLSYHKNRFHDESLVIKDGGSTIGYMLAARSETDASVVVSHPGATFSGLVFSDVISGMKLVEILELILKHYRSIGYSALVYKELPSIYSSRAMGDFRYATFRNKGIRSTVLLSSVLDLRKANEYSSRRIRALKKVPNSLSLSSDWSLISKFWDVLSENLLVQHNSLPVHTIEEIKLIGSFFPNDVSLVTAVDNDSDDVVAGVLLFKCKRVWKTQYISSSVKGRTMNALDFVLDECIRFGRSQGVAYFDLGTSNEADGLILNEGLYQFKSEFGAEGTAYEHFRFEFT